ncbi:MAG TPA: hypothetical protein VHR66_21825 [Gemmataceae bacterium]|jgi:hypothetical protein|nr:hypothetical protein [Gemmataceae bacterium]
MSLILSTMPDQPAELGPWLDRQIAGPDLRRLTTELSAVHGQQTDGSNLDAVLGDDRAAVMENGLRALSEERLRLLLRHPTLLADLQDAVAAAGKPYWDELFDHPTLAKLVHRARREPVRPVRVLRPVVPVYRRPWFVASATVVIVMMTVLMHRPPRPNWGWNNNRAINRGRTAADHLNALADAAEQWSNQPRQRTAELRRTLREMRDGCTSLLAADHRILGPEDHAWLLERCVAWGTLLDRHLADLQEGRSTDDVRAEADETVRKLVEALRQRAGEAPD